MLPTIKRGDTFAFVINLVDESGIGVTDALEYLSSEIRNEKDEKIETLTISETQVAGEYLIGAPDTSSWPVGTYLYSDVQYERDGIISSSETIRILLDKDVTR